MGGGDAPFIYDRPQSWNFGGPVGRGFNPRAATEASWTPRTPRQKPNGPLIDFNKHPDSYLVVPYGNLNAQPMHPSTKKRLMRVRTLQLCLRCLALIGALGLLFCIIAINKTTTAVAWIIRVAPAVATCHTFYAVCHLSRTITSRTPGSTASYMIFAGLLDLGLIPFFAFSAYMGYLDHSQNLYEWSTLFADGDLTEKIIFAFFILNAVEGSLILVSMMLNIYMAITFRKIAKLPPDMNPLEENLTSRFGHKRNKSSMNVTEKHMSASTLVTNRSSGMGKRVPYVHTRTDSADSVTLYGGNSARNSRVEMRKGFDEFHTDPYRISTASLPGSPLRPNSAHSPAPNARAPGTGLDHRPARSSVLNTSPQRSPARSPERPSSWLSYMDYEGMPTELSENAESQLDQEVRPLSPVSAISSHGPITHAWSNRPSFDLERKQQTTSNAKGDITHAAALMAPKLLPVGKRSREPLGMHPPSPAQKSFDLNDENNPVPPYHHSPADPTSSPVRPALTPTNGNSRPSSFIGSGTKSRFYGDLRASISNIPDQWKEPEPHVTEIHNVDDGEEFAHNGYGVDRSHTNKSAMTTSDYSANIEVYASDSDEDMSPIKPNYRYFEQSPYASTATLESPSNSNLHSHTPPPPQSPPPRTAMQPMKDSPRQVSSSTGHDLQSGYAGLGAEFGLGMARRRDVSGKVAEEGRGGNYRWDVKTGAEPIEEELTPKKPGYKSAGWARFKGL
jgi:hypothetical protein